MLPRKIVEHGHHSPWRNTFGKVKKVGERGAVLIEHKFFFFDKLPSTKLKKQ